MKKLLILLSLSLLISLGGYAQKNKRTSAFMYNKNKQYDKAMAAIDEAIMHEKTANDAKTWMYRGIIYYNIANDTLPEVNALSPDAAEISIESFIKSKELDVKNSLKGQATIYLVNLTNIFYQKGADSFKVKDYEDAFTNFEQSFEISQMDDRFDSITVLYAGMSAVYGENYEGGIVYLQKLVDVKYNDPLVYSLYSQANKKVGDTTAAFSILSEGRELFPNETSLQLAETQLYLETGNTEKLISGLKEALVADPVNPSLYVILGQAYENLAAIDTLNTTTHYIDSAIVNYQKSIELKPDFSSAIFNLGAIYVNRAVPLITEMNNLDFDETEKYNKLKTESDADLMLALPYLEQSLALDPTDKDIVNTLKEVYARLKMNDKLKELMDK